MNGREEERAERKEREGKEGLHGTGVHVEGGREGGREVGRIRQDRVT